MSASKQQKERDKAVNHLMDYLSTSPKWSSRFDALIAEFLEPIASQFEDEIESIQRRLFDGPHGHMAFGFLFEEMASSSWENEPQTPVEDYLQSRGWREGTHGRRYLRSLAEANLHLLEITAVEPGHWIAVRPFGTVDEPTRVMERTASQTLVQWDCIVARLLTEGKHYRFTGAILHLSRLAARYIREQLNAVPGELADIYQELVKEGDTEGVTVDLVDQIPDVLRNRLTDLAFTSWAVEILADKPATRFSNTDNERLVMTRFRFPLKADKSVIVGELLQHPGILECEDGRLTWLKAENSRTVQGWISIDGQHLNLETNSVERSTRGISLIQKLLGDKVGQPMGVHENTETLLFETPSFPDTDAELANVPEVQAAIRQHIEDHYRKTLDEPVPMLDNESPRVCAADPAKQQMVIDWLKYLENTDRRTPGPAQDFHWMWEELGLTKYR